MNLIQRIQRDMFNTCIKFISEEDYRKQRKRPVRKPPKNQISIGEMNE